jgi:hypothetical protein
MPNFKVVIKVTDPNYLMSSWDEEIKTEELSKVRATIKAEGILRKKYPSKRIKLQTKFVGYADG